MLFKPTLSQMSFYTGESEIDTYLWNQGVMQVFPCKYSYKELNNAFNLLVKNNDSLRIKMVHTKHGPRMNLEEYTYRTYPHWICSSMKELKKKARQFLNQPIDFKGDLVRCAVFETPEVSGIMISGHHIVVDGYSVIVMAEHINNYLKDPDYAPYDYQRYIEYIESEDKYRTTKRYQLAKEFWKKEFQSNPVCSLYYDEKATIDYSSSEENITVTPVLFEKIRKFCIKSNISIQSFFNTVYSAYFFKTTEHKRFTLGVPVLNRTTEAELNTIGLYMHIVPLVIEITDNSFLNNTLKIESSQLNLFRYQKFTQTEILKNLEDSGMSVSRLFDVTSDFQQFEHDPFYDLEIPYSNFLSVPLEIHMQSFGEKKHNLKIRYRTSMFTETEIRNMLNSFIAIAEDVIKNPHKKISEIEMISDSEKNKILNDFNDTSHIYKICKDSTIYSLFEKTAKENKNRICIRTAEKNLTFGELRTISENLDMRIREITNGKKSVIAVIAERSVEMYASIYGIIRGGNAYLPIDPDYPQDRINYILENSKAAAVVVQSKFADKAGYHHYIDATDFIATTKSKAIELPVSAAAPEDTAYIIYTSGSTGAPKGAKVSHKSALNRILWMHDKYPLESNGVILQKTPYTFDVSVWELFWWGICGGCLAASKPREHFLPAKILEEAEKNKVTHIHFVPSVFELFLNYIETHKEEICKFNSLRYVFLSGESLTSNLVNRFYKLFDFRQISLHNLYGPTECAVDVTYYDCLEQEVDPIPIGKPIYNTHMYVVDNHCKLVPVGMTGELCIGGVNVGQGYLNNDELTDQKFVNNPFAPGKMYKTGDLAYWDETGNIVFIGRKDSQIKLNGQRIELGEIESVICNINGITSSAVIAKKTNGKDILIAFYTGEERDASYIRDFCLEKLPKYMTPSIFKHLNSLPLNQSGKLDRHTLAKFEIETNVASEFLAPINPMEIFVCNAFKKNLGIKNISKNSDYFEIGGTSLSMISLLSETEFEGITTAEFMKNPTPELLSVLLTKKKKSVLKYLEPLYLSDTTKKVVILLPFAGGGAEAYSAFVNTLKKKNNISVFFIRYLHSIDDCEKAADEISDILGDKEIFIYSHCVGAAVALPIISSLENRNVSVKQYFAGASIPPTKPITKNIWNIVPDLLLKTILIKAGADIKGLKNDILTDLFDKFRNDTDFANLGFSTLNSKIKTPVKVIISKNDLFTKNYKQAGKIWKKYAENVTSVEYICSNNHYFQSSDSELLIKIIFGMNS